MTGRFDFRCSAAPPAFVTFRTALRAALGDIGPMDKPDHPFITADLVMPSLRTCEVDSHRYPALVFAERGPLVLFAAEYARRFGVGVLNDEGRVVEADQYPSLDDAAREFLARKLSA
jgi:hypothetical protein